MPGPADFRIHGLRALDRALGKADKNLRRNLRDHLKDVADVVAVEAQDIARSKGLVESGDLVRGIKPFALTGRAGVRSGATHRSFNYPRRLEYENRRGGTYGPRATLHPAVERKLDDVDRGLEQMLDRLEDDFTGGILT